MRESHVSQHLSGAHSSIPLFCTSFPQIATASQGTIRVGSSENSMFRPFRRVGRVALRRSLPQQTWRFPRIDSRSIEASSAPTRRGAACARGCRLKAGTPLALLAYSVQWPRGEFKETLGDRSRRRLTDLSAQSHPRERLSAFRFNERVRPKEVRTPDPNGHFELGGHSPRAGAFGRLGVSGRVDF